MSNISTLKKMCILLLSVTLIGSTSDVLLAQNPLPGFWSVHRSDDLSDTISTNGGTYRIYNSGPNDVIVHYTSDGDRIFLDCESGDSVDVTGDSETDIDVYIASGTSKCDDSSWNYIKMKDQ